MSFTFLYLDILLVIQPTVLLSHEKSVKSLNTKASDNITTTKNTAKYMNRGAGRNFMNMRNMIAAVTRDDTISVMVSMDTMADDLEVPKSFFSMYILSGSPPILATGV